MKRKILSIVMAVLMLSALFSVTAFAEGETAIADTELFWKFDTDTLTITGTGAIPDYVIAISTPWESENNNITKIVVSDGVTSIGDYAFTKTKAEDIEIPASITDIGDYAFPTTLKTATIPCTLEDYFNEDSIYSKVEITLTHDTENAVKTEAKDATTSADGNIEYYTCPGCKGLFKDADLEKETTAEEVKVKATDTEAPEIVSVSVSRETISQPGTVEVTVKATDNATGVSGGSISFTYMTNNESYSCDLKLKANSNSSPFELTGTLTFPETASSATYYISSITLTDGAGNKKTTTLTTLTEALKKVKITVSRGSVLKTNATLTLNATSVGYGGTVTGTVVLKDEKNNALANKTFDIYVGTAKTTITATTDATGTATFKYSNTVPGTYSLKASFLGTDDYAACETSAVSVTFTSVPATGDSYDVLLWGCVALLAVGANLFFFIRRRKA